MSDAMTASQFAVPVATNKETEITEVLTTRNITAKDYPFEEPSELHQNLAQHPKDVNTITVFANGRRVATTSIDGKVRIYDLRLVGDAVHVLNWDCRALSAIGRNVLAAFCGESNLRTYVIEQSGNVILLSEVEVDTFGTAIARLGDKNLVLSNSFGDLLFYSHTCGRKLRYDAYLRAHSESVSVLSVRGGKLVSGSTDFTCGVWDWKTKKRLATLTHERAVTACAINEKFIFTASMAMDMCIWHNGGGYAKHAVFRNYHNSEPVLSLLPLGSDLLLSADRVGDLLYTRVSTHKIVSLVEVVGAGKLSDVALTTSGRIAAVGCSTEQDMGYASVLNPPKIVKMMVQAHAFKLFPKSASTKKFRVFSPEPEPASEKSSADSSVTKDVTPPKKRAPAQRKRRSIRADSSQTVSTSKHQAQAPEQSSVSEASRVFSAYVPPYHVRKETKELGKTPRRSLRNRPPTQTSNEKEIAVIDEQLMDEMFNDPPVPEEKTPQSGTPSKNGTQEVSPTSKEKRRFVPPGNMDQPGEQKTTRVDPSVPSPRPEMNTGQTNVEMAPSILPVATESVSQPAYNRSSRSEERTENRKRGPFRENEGRHPHRDGHSSRREDPRNHRRNRSPLFHTGRRHRRSPSPYRSRRNDRVSSPRREDSRHRSRREHSPNRSRSSGRRYDDSRTRRPNSPSDRYHSRYRSRSPRRYSHRPENRYCRDYDRSRTPPRRRSSPPTYIRSPSHSRRRFERNQPNTRIGMPPGFAPRSAEEERALSRVVVPPGFELRRILPQWRNVNRPASSVPPALAHLNRREERFSSWHDERGNNWERRSRRRYH